MVLVSFDPQRFGPMALSPKQIEQKVADVGVAKAEMAPARAFVLAVMAGVFDATRRTTDRAVGCR